MHLRNLMRSVASTGVLITAVMSAPHSMAQDATAYVDKASGLTITGLKICSPKSWPAVPA